MPSSAACSMRRERSPVLVPSSVARSPSPSPVARPVRVGGPLGPRARVEAGPARRKPGRLEGEQVVAGADARAAVDDHLRAARVGTDVDAERLEARGAARRADGSGRAGRGWRRTARCGRRGRARPGRRWARPRPGSAPVRGRRGRRHRRCRGRPGGRVRRREERGRPRPQRERRGRARPRRRSAVARRSSVRPGGQAAVEQRGGLARAPAAATPGGRPPCRPGRRRPRPRCLSPMPSAPRPAAKRSGDGQRDGARPPPSGGSASTTSRSTHTAPGTWPAR